MYAIIPNTQLNTDEIAHKCFYGYFNKSIQISELDTLKYKVKQIALNAVDDNRGCVIDSHPHDLIKLCNKYGGVVQCLRTGSKIHVNQNGSALSDWHMVGKPYESGDISHIKGNVILQALDETYHAPVVFLTNGVRSVCFIRHITDIPEIIELIKYRHYRV